MLQINNLTIKMAQTEKVILDSFTFALNPGDRAAIIGEEGNGKSTLLRIIHGDSPDYVEYSGTVLRSGERIGYVAQELPREDLALTTGEYIRRECGDASPSAVAAAASSLRLPLELLCGDRLVATLSGGEKVKLRTAPLLINGCTVMLLDEPTNDLDLETVTWLEQFVQKSRVPVIYISHDETLLERTANVIIHLELVRKKTLPRWTVSRIGYADYVGRRGSALEQQERMARKEREIQRAKEARWQQIFERVEHEQNSVSRQDPGAGRLLKKKMKTVKAQKHRYEREAESMTELPDTEDAILMDFPPEATVPASKRVLAFELTELAAGGRVLARNIRLDVTGPERVGIVGRNGAGKTTLLRELAAGLLARSDVHAAYMPQDYAEGLDPEATPVEYLAGSPLQSDITRARNYLGSVRFTRDEMLARTRELSGGQKAKLFFLKMILSGADVLVLDEPTRNFSPLSNPVIRRILKNYSGAVIAVSHDRKFLTEVCTRVCELTETGLTLAKI